MSKDAVDEYLAGVSTTNRTALNHIRSLILAIVPEATEVITYGMPGFKYRGKYLVAYCAFKDHLSVFPGAQAIETHTDALADFKISKGTVQFTIQKPIEDSLLKALVLTRKRAIDESAQP